MLFLCIDAESSTATSYIQENFHTSTEYGLTCLTSMLALCWEHVNMLTPKTVKPNRTTLFCRLSHINQIAVVLDRFIYN